MKKFVEYAYLKYDKTHKTTHSTHQIFLLLKIFLNQNAKPY